MKLKNQNLKFTYMCFGEFDQSGPCGKLIAMHVFNLYGNAMSSVIPTQRTKTLDFQKTTLIPICSMNLNSPKINIEMS